MPLNQILIGIGAKLDMGSHRHKPLYTHYPVSVSVSDISEKQKVPPYGGLLYRPMKKKVKGEGWLTGLSRYMNDKEIVIKWNLTPLHIV